MADKTGIEWTDATWNPTKGCDRVSAGCDHCYAMTLAPRLKAMGSPAYQQDGDPRTSGPGFLAHEWPAVLDQPLRWTKPRRIFVNSMSDLFHDKVSDEFIAEVFAVMALAPQHTFQILTKRHARMRSLLSSDDFRADVTNALLYRTLHEGRDDQHLVEAQPDWYPLPNVWLGVSVEDQQWADIRIPALLATPAAVRFLSCEPLLGPIDLLGPPGYQECADMGPAWTHEGVAHRTDYGTGVEYDCQHDIGIDWVIVGGESDPGARPMDREWARWLRDQCQAVEISYLFKQWGSHDAAGQPMSKHAAGRELDGRTWDEYPAGAA